LADSSHPGYDEQAGWIGDELDPAAFSLEHVNIMLRTQFSRASYPEVAISFISRMSLCLHYSSSRAIMTFGAPSFGRLPPPE
jgi:hypothetical protein